MLRGACATSSLLHTFPGGTLALGSSPLPLPLVSILLVTQGSSTATAGSNLHCGSFKPMLLSTHPWSASLPPALCSALANYIIKPHHHHQAAAMLQGAERQNPLLGQHCDGGGCWWDKALKLGCANSKSESVMASPILRLSWKNWGT